MDFYCENCKAKFEHEGEKREFNNPIYGPCAKYIAPCPTCNADCEEVLKPKLHSSAEIPSGPSCNGGSCCCMN